MGLLDYSLGSANFLIEMCLNKLGNLVCTLKCIIFFIYVYTSFKKFRAKLKDLVRDNHPPCPSHARVR